MGDVRLVIGAEVHAGWTEIRVMRSIEAVADTFDLTLTERWADGEEPRPIRVGSACELWIDGERVVTGYVDDVAPSYDAKSHTVTASGRSKAGDLVDCSLAGTLQWKGRTLLGIARDLVGRFGIEVSSEVGEGEAFRAEALEPGEPVWDFLEQLARRRAVRFVSQADGNLLITRAGTGRTETPLRLGENILRASGEFSMRERFSDYIVQAQQSGWDGTSGAASAHVKSQAKDDGVARYRPTVVLADGPGTLADVKRRADWQRNTAWGRGQGVVYTVHGWRHADGLWEPNRMVHVEDPWLGISGDRLIVSVQLLLGGEGELAELRLMPREAADLVRLPDPKKGGEGWLP